MNTQDQVSRLEALLTKVQHNAATLRRERGGSEAEVAGPRQGAGVTRTSSPWLSPLAAAKAVSAAPTGAASVQTIIAPPVPAPAVTEPPLATQLTAVEPLELTPETPAAEAPLPADAMDAFAAAEQALLSQPAAAPVRPASHPPTSPTLIPASNEPLEADLESLSSYPPALEDESLEHTKPLWVGIGQPTEPSAPPRANSRVTVPPTTQPPEFTSASLPPLADPELEIAPSIETDRRDSSPPLSGERPSTRTPSMAPDESSMSLEEPLASATSAATPTRDEPRFSDAPPAMSLAEPLETDAAFADDRESRISDAPASALGATITLPDDPDGVELELAEPPPSSLRTIAPGAGVSPEDELEADLPRTSLRAAYDDSLSSPPEARSDLIAHDNNVRERSSSNPAPDAYITEPPISEVTHPAAYAAAEDTDLPPVLSSRPNPPVTIPPQSAVEPLHTSARALTPDTDFGQSVPLTGPDAPTAVQFAPTGGAVAATFEGSVRRVKDASFLELLDVSLSLDARG